MANTPERGNTGDVKVCYVKDVTIQNVGYAEVDDSVAVVAENIEDLFVCNVRKLSTTNVKKVVICEKEST